MSTGTVSGIVTAVLTVVFIGVVMWAYGAKRKAGFDAAARLPLEEDSSKERL